MSVPDITLNKGMILLTQSASGLGIVMDNSPFVNAAVAKINDLEENYKVEDLILFDPTNATKFIYDDTNYYLVETDKIVYKENFIPPP